MSTLTIDFSQDLDDVRCYTDEELGSDIREAHQTWSRKYRLHQERDSWMCERPKNNKEYQHLTDLKEARAQHRRDCGVCRLLGKSDRSISCIRQ